jgi:hypothetical protein
MFLLSASAILSVCEHIQAKEDAVGVIVGDREGERGTAALPGAAERDGSFPLAATVYPALSPVAVYVRVQEKPASPAAVAGLAVASVGLPVLVCSSAVPGDWALFRPPPPADGEAAAAASATTLTVVPWQVETDVAVSVVQSVAGARGGALAASLAQVEARAGAVVDSVAASATASPRARARSLRTARRLVSQLRRSHALAESVARHGTGQRAASLIPPLAASTRGLAALDRVVREASLRLLHAPSLAP